MWQNRFGNISHSTQETSCNSLLWAQLVIRLSLFLLQAFRFEVSLFAPSAKPPQID